MTMTFEKFCNDTLARCRSGLEAWAKLVDPESCEEGFVENLVDQRIIEAGMVATELLDMDATIGILRSRPDLFEGELGDRLKLELHTLVVRAVAKDAEDYAQSLGLFTVTEERQEKRP